MSGPERPQQVPPLTVAQLCARIKGALDAGFPAAISVAGEVSGFSDRTHWYFALKDEAALINCVMFANAAKKAGFTPVPGQQVVARGRADFYAPHGKVTLIVDRLEPLGQGSRELAFKALVEECRALGWLDPARKRPLPLLPRRVAIVTSMNGAAVRDVIVTMHKRCCAVPLLTLDVKVQGDRAVPEVVRALEYLSANAAPLGIDAILLTRGGGSTEDLWAFNDREVARAIVASSIPVVAAIGHETDVTLAELVADERCATPTQAAMRLSPDGAALARQVAALESRLGLLLSRQIRHEAQRTAQEARALAAALRERVARARARTDALVARVQRRSPRAVHAATLERLARARQSLVAALRNRLLCDDHESYVKRTHMGVRAGLGRANVHLEGLCNHLRAVGPLRVLERGYSVTLRADGRAVRSPAEVSPGEAIQTRVAEGVIRSVVWETAAPPPTRKPASASRPKREPDPSTPNLFGPP